jgi:hypothetical protein
MRKLIFIVVLTLLVLGFKGCGHEKDINQALDAVGIPSSAAEFKHNYKTPAGIEVKSVVDLPPHALFAIDQGILIQIDRLDHLRPMWNNYKDIRQYKVLVVEPGAYSTVDLPGAPLLMLRDGVTTAGTVIGIGGTASLGTTYIIVPHQNGQSWRFMDFFKEAVHNESEHARECNEPSRENPSPECTKFFGVNDKHPHQYDQP